MRYRVTIEFGTWSSGLDAASHSEAIEKATGLVRDQVTLEFLVRHAIVTVQALDESEEERGD